MTSKNVLPDEIRAESLEQKTQRLVQLDPTCRHALDLIVTDALEIRWKKEFHAGPRGGLKLKGGK